MKHSLRIIKTVLYLKFLQVNKKYHKVVIILYAVHCKHVFRINGQVAAECWLKTNLQFLVWKHIILCYAYAIFWKYVKALWSILTVLGSRWRLSIEKVVSLSGSLGLTSSYHLKGLIAEKEKE